MKGGQGMVKGLDDRLGAIDDLLSWLKNNQT